MLNAIGLQNVGVDAFLAEKLPELARLGATVIANVWGDTEDDYVAVVERIGDERRVAAIEVNVSCPNVVRGGMVFGNNPEALAALVKRIRSATRHPLVVKLSPNVTDIVASARAAVDAGADALSLINTLVGLAIDLERREPKIGFTTGGLSGPAIRPIALRMVWEVRTALPKIPIFGMGGIETVEHVVEFLVAGANAVQIGTANFRDPSLAGPARRGARRVVREPRRRARLRPRRHAPDAPATGPLVRMNRQTPDARARLAVALDLPDRTALLAMARRLAPEAGVLKVGLEAFVAEGPTLVRDLVASGADVFLDLKLHDIPNTVGRAAAAAVATGAAIVNCHAAGRHGDDEGVRRRGPRRRREGGASRRRSSSP